MAGCVMLALIALFSFFGPFHRHILRPGVSILRLDPAEPRAAADACNLAGRDGRRCRTAASISRSLPSTARPSRPRHLRRADRSPRHALLRPGQRIRRHRSRWRENDGQTLKVTGSVNREYFLFGTDSNGRDLMARVMLGGQISIAVGLLASLVSLSSASVMARFRAMSAVASTTS